jgi:hypothetical protein
MRRRLRGDEEVLIEKRVGASPGLARFAPVRRGALSALAGPARDQPCALESGRESAQGYGVGPLEIRPSDLLPEAAQCDAVLTNAALWLAPRRRECLGAFRRRRWHGVA